VPPSVNLPAKGAQLVEGGLVGRIDGERLAEISNSVGLFPERLVTHGAVFVRIRVQGIELYCFGKIVDCPSMIALERVSLAAIIIGDEIFRMNFDRLIEILDGPIERSAIAIGAAAIAVGRAVDRLKPDRLGVVGDCSLVVFFSEMGGATAIVGVAIARIEPDCLGAIGQRMIMIALVPVGKAAAAVGPRPFGIELERLAVVRD